MQTKVIAGALIGAVLIAAGASAALTSSSSKTKAVVKTGHALGKRVLVTRSGLTLYSLSAETHGRFICTNSSCLAVWHPLTVTKGTKPTGASHLGTIRRPDGRTQVTYKGLPTYTFAQDKKPGDAKGEGFKDVGTWHAVSLGSGAMTAPKSTSTTPSYPSY